jgi:hypothetical protein
MGAGLQRVVDDETLDPLAHGGDKPVMDAVTMIRDEAVQR